MKLGKLVNSAVKDLFKAILQEGRPVYIPPSNEELRALIKKANLGTTSIPGAPPISGTVEDALRKEEESVALEGLELKNLMRDENLMHVGEVPEKDFMAIFSRPEYKATKPPQEELEQIKSEGVHQLHPGRWMNKGEEDVRVRRYLLTKHLIGRGLAKVHKGMPLISRSLIEPVITVKQAKQNAAEQKKYATAPEKPVVLPKRHFSGLTGEQITSLQLPEEAKKAMDFLSSAHPELKRTRVRSYPDFFFGALGAIQAKGILGEGKNKKPVFSFSPEERETIVHPEFLPLGLVPYRMPKKGIRPYDRIKELEKERIKVSGLPSQLTAASIGRQPEAPEFIAIMLETDFTPEKLGIKLSPEEKAHYTLADKYFKTLEKYGKENIKEELHKAINTFINEKLDPIVHDLDRELTTKLKDIAKQAELRGVKNFLDIPLSTKMIPSEVLMLHREEQDRENRKQIDAIPRLSKQDYARLGTPDSEAQSRQALLLAKDKGDRLKLPVTPREIMGLGLLTVYGKVPKGFSSKFNALDPSMTARKIESYIPYDAEEQIKNAERIHNMKRSVSDIINLAQAKAHGYDSSNPIHVAFTSRAPTAKEGVEDHILDMQGKIDTFFDFREGKKKIEDVRNKTQEEVRAAGTDSAAAQRAKATGAIQELPLLLKRAHHGAFPDATSAGRGLFSYLESFMEDASRFQTDADLVQDSYDPETKKYRVEGKLTDEIPEPARRKTKSVHRKRIAKGLASMHGKALEYLQGKLKDATNPDYAEVFKSFSQAREEKLKSRMPQNK